MGTWKVELEGSEVTEVRVAFPVGGRRDWIASGVHLGFVWGVGVVVAIGRVMARARRAVRDMVKVLI